MIPSPVGAMDLKIAQNKNSAKNSKAKDDKSFAKEISASEKKLKKRTAQEDSLAAQQSQNRNTMNHSNPKTESQAANQSVPQVKNLDPQQNSAQNANVQEASTDSETLGDLLSHTETAMVPQSANLIKNMSGKMSIEGMEMVNPQTIPQLTLENGEQNPTPELSADSLATVQLEQTGKDSLLQENLSDSKDSNDFQFEFGSEISQTPIQNKETVKNQQAFATLLENKTQSTENVKKENVDYLVQQASTILKDGGGEMKLQLRPEGLGTVDLKVGVNQGQVSIEIMAQDKDIKKLFDDSIVDIRSALETQNLKVDIFKVGVSENFDQSLAQRQFQMMDQDFARNFMGQFRDERQSLRQQGIDSFIGNKSPLDSKPEGLQPLQSRVNSNGRLNIIA